MNDLSFFACIFLLIGTAAGALGYIVGKRHGYEAGYLVGSATEHSRTLCVAIKAKRDGQHTGRILGMREAIREMMPVITPTNNRKPAISRASVS